MADTRDKIVHTNFIGRTIVDLNLLLRDPKVRRTMEKLSEANKSMRGRPGVHFVKLGKLDG